MHVQKNEDGRISLLAVTSEERDLLADLKDQLKGDFEYCEAAGLLFVGPPTAADGTTRRACR